MPNLKKDKVFKAARDANPISGIFDTHNGDFDTPGEFIRAYLNNDKRALDSLNLQNMEQLRDVLEQMSPEIAEQMRERIPTYEEIYEQLEDLRRQQELAPAA